MKNQQVLLTIEEAAASLAICRAQVYRLMYAGQIRSIKIGRSNRIPLIEVQNFVTRASLEQHGIDITEVK
jgi:excisionase family DNA binding protein